MIAQHSILHVRYNGRSVDAPLAQLDIGQHFSDQDIRTAAARYLNVTERDLRDYVVDRHQTGNVTIRPAAVFG